MPRYYLEKTKTAVTRAIKAADKLLNKEQLENKFVSNKTAIYLQ